jgi:hypothetical protein
VNGTDRTVSAAAGAATLSWCAGQAIAWTGEGGTICVVLFAALSCLQGLRAGDAAEALLAAGVDGIQLTAGCAPDDRLAETVAATAVRTHHGYSPHALRAKVWDSDAVLYGQTDSVHPPRRGLEQAFFTRLEDGTYGDVAFETMYPGYTLGDEASLRRYLATGQALAVDVSHLHLQIVAGVLSAQGAELVYNYTNIAEIHVSRDEHGRDAHRPFTGGDYQVGWVRERNRAGAVVVVECYTHRMSAAERQAQFEVVADAID